MVFSHKFLFENILIEEDLLNIYFKMYKSGDKFSN